MSKCFVCTCNGQLAGFSASLNFVHPRKWNTYREHRLVVLPDFQGIGIGTALSNYVAEYFLKQGKTYITNTSNPARIHGLKNSNLWRCTNIGRVRTRGRNGAQYNAYKGLYKTASCNRITVSFEYIKHK